MSVTIDQEVAVNCAQEIHHYLQTGHGDIERVKAAMVLVLGFVMGDIENEKSEYNESKYKASN